MTRPREPAHTVALIDEYCARYRKVFTDVRHFEQFTQLELGLLAEAQRKSLPRLAQFGKADHQALHHFLSNADWPIDHLRAIRWQLTREALARRRFILCIDDTGDHKKGPTTDYAARQYIGNLRSHVNGVVALSAYGVLDTVMFPLAFRVYKPVTRLNMGDVYKTKPQLTIELIQEAQAAGFHFNMVLADSSPDDSGNLLIALRHLELRYVIAIRYNHVTNDEYGDWSFPGKRLWRNRWRPLGYGLIDRSMELCFIREIIVGSRKDMRFIQITSDPATLPPRATWNLLTNLPGKLERALGNGFALRTWIRYGFKQARDELGWADYRMTHAVSLERWWELVMCAYLLVSRQSPMLTSASSMPCVERAASVLRATAEMVPPAMSPLEHSGWIDVIEWEQQLANLRLHLRPFA